MTSVTSGCFVASHLMQTGGTHWSGMREVGGVEGR